MKEESRKQAEEYFKKEFGVSPTAISAWHSSPDPKAGEIIKYSELVLSSIDLWDLMNGYKDHCLKSPDASFISKITGEYCPSCEYFIDKTLDIVEKTKTCSSCQNQIKQTNK